MGRTVSDSASPLTQTGRDIVRLGPYQVVVPGGVQRQGLGRFAGKVTIGDYTLDSDDILSAWVQSSFQGGMGTLVLREGTTDDQFWDATLETRSPEMLGLLRDTIRVDGPEDAVNFYPLASFPASAPSLWGAFDRQLVTFNPAGPSFTDASATLLAAPPVGKAVEWLDALYIPLGPAGYAAVTAGGTVTAAATPGVVAFAVWDNFLCALCTDGFLRLLNQAGTWEADNPALQLPSGEQPRGLVRFLNQRQDPTLHLVTNHAVWAYDRDTPRIYPTHLEYPTHPMQGKASCNWRGDAMFVSVGLGIHRYNGATIAAMGPDGRYSLPAGLRGAITDLEPEYNNLIATVAGETGTGSGAVVEHLRVGEPLYRPPQVTFQTKPVRSCILRWTEQGWHKVWESGAASGAPSWALVSSADNAYRLFWGYGGDAYYQDLPLDFANALTLVQEGSDRFLPGGSLTTGWFDAGMTGFSKLASHVEVELADPLENGDPLGLVSVYYQVDGGRDWTHLGEATTAGLTVLPFGLGPHPVDPSLQFSYGLSFRKIRFRYDISRRVDHPEWTPLVSSIILKFLKVPLTGQLAWQMTIDLTKDYFGDGIDTVRNYLFAAIGATTFVPMIHKGVPYRVRLAQSQGPEPAGPDPRGTITLQVIGLPVPDSAPLPVTG